MSTSSRQPEIVRWHGSYQRIDIEYQRHHRKEFAAHVHHGAPASDGPDVGETYPRMALYFPATGKARVKRLRSLHNNVISSQENSYIDSVIKKPMTGDIELF